MLPDFAVFPCHLPYLTGIRRLGQGTGFSCRYDAVIRGLELASERMCGTDYLSINGHRCCSLIRPGSCRSLFIHESLLYLRLAITDMSVESNSPSRSRAVGDGGGLIMETDHLFAFFNSAQPRGLSPRALSSTSSQDALMWGCDTHKAARLRGLMHSRLGASWLFTSEHNSHFRCSEGGIRSIHHHLSLFLHLTVNASPSKLYVGS